MFVNSNILSVLTQLICQVIIKIESKNNSGVLCDQNSYNLTLVDLDSI